MGDWLGSGGDDDFGDIGNGGSSSETLRFKVYDAVEAHNDTGFSGVLVRSATFSYSSVDGLVPETSQPEFEVSGGTPDMIVKPYYLRIDGTEYLVLLIEKAGSVCLYALQRGETIPTNPCSDSNSLYGLTGYEPEFIMASYAGNGKILARATLWSDFGSYSLLLELNLSDNSVTILDNNGDLSQNTGSVMNVPFVGLTAFKSLPFRIYRYNSGSFQGVTLENGDNFSDYLAITERDSNHVFLVDFNLQDQIESYYSCDYDGSSINNCEFFYQTNIILDLAPIQSTFRMQAFKIKDGYYVINHAYKASYDYNPKSQPIFYSEKDNYVGLIFTQEIDSPYGVMYVEEVR